MNRENMKTIQFDLTIDDANLVLEALGTLPFARVYSLIGRIQEHARRQLESASMVAVDRERNELDG
jgi:hypothetical protein